VIGIVAESPQAEVPVTSDPSSFREKTDVWRPLQIDSSSSDGNGYLTVAARLRFGVTLATANAELELATQQFRRNIPGMAQHSFFAVRTMKTVLDRTVRNELLILWVAVGFVLLIACSNVASLSLSRSADRRREFSIRAAVGAGRRRLIRQLLTESVILSLAGGALGIMLGFAGIRGILALDSAHIPRVGQFGSMVSVDWRVLLFTVALSVTTGILFGLLPAFHGSSTDLNEMLKQSAGNSSAGFWKQNARSLLVAAEIAIALVLLIGTAQMIRGFMAVRFANPGFDPRNVLTMRMSLTSTRFGSTAGLSQLAETSVARLSSLPGVLSAAATCCVPLDSVDDYLIGDVIIAGRLLNGRSHGSVNVTTVTPGYFDVLRIPLLQGRALAAGDKHASEPVVVVSEALAHKFWPNGLKDDPLDAQLTFPDFPENHWRIVGIVGDIHAAGLETKAPPIVYFPMAQTPDELTEYIVRSPIGWLVRTREDSRGIRS
jgi:predicted permease